MEYMNYIYSMGGCLPETALVMSTNIADLVELARATSIEYIWPTLSFVQ